MYSVKIPWFVSLYYAFLFIEHSVALQAEYDYISYISNE